MASFLTPTAEYGQFAKRYYESADEMAKQRREEERLALLARQQAASERESTSRIKLAETQESRAAAAFTEQQRKAAALRAAMKESIPAEPTSIVRGPAAAGGIPGLRVPAERAAGPLPSVPGVSVTPPSAPSGGLAPPPYRLGGPKPEDVSTEVTPTARAGLPAFGAPLAASGATGLPRPSFDFPVVDTEAPPYQQYQARSARAVKIDEALSAVANKLSLIAFPRVAPSGPQKKELAAAQAKAKTVMAWANSSQARETLSKNPSVIEELYNDPIGFYDRTVARSPTPAEDEAALTAEAAAVAGVTPQAPSAAEEVAATPSDQPVQVADVGRRLYTLEKAQVARARKELSAQRKEVVRMMKQAQAVEDLTAFNNARLLLLKIDGQIEDKNRVDQLLTFRDSTGTKTLEPLAKQLNELTDGRVEIEALEDGTFNLYDNGTDSETPFTPKPLTREELWNQLDLAFNNDRIAKEQAAITAQAEAQAKLSEEYAKAMGKGEAERELNKRYPQADYIQDEDPETKTPIYFDRNRNYPPMRLITEPVIVNGKPVVDPRTNQPQMQSRFEEIPMPGLGVRPGMELPPGTYRNKFGVIQQK